MSTTTDLSKFGYRELAILRDLLSAMLEHGLPDDFWDNEVVPMMNTYSGNVFLTNSEYEVAMLTGDGTLESWYYLNGTGIEGFYDDLISMYEDGTITDDDDLEQLADLCENHGDSDKADEIREALEASEE